MKASEFLQNDQSTASENALRRAVDTTPAFIHTARPDGYIDYFNRGWLDFFGKSLDDVCGWRWTETVHPDDVAAIVQKWHAALASGEPFEIETRVRRADGSYRALLHRKLPLRDEHGNIVKWFGSSIDIEDRKRAERKIAEKTSELEQREFYLREGERLAHMGSWSLRPDGIFDYWSPETFSIFGAHLGACPAQVGQPALRAGLKSGGAGQAGHGGPCPAARERRNQRVLVVRQGQILLRGRQLAGAPDQTDDQARRKMA